MTDIYNWLLANWGTILEVLGALLAAASVITALTPTPTDDGVVAWIRNILGRISALTHSDAPGTVSAPLLQRGDEPILKERARL